MDNKQISKLSKLSTYLRVMSKMAGEGHLSAGRQAFEMVLLFIRRGLGPGYYLGARFWRREIPLHDKLRHLNEHDYVKHLNKLNDPTYQKISQNKVVEKAVLSLFSIPTPRFLGHLQALTGLSSSGTSLRNGFDLEQLLNNIRPEALCFKLVEGWGGTGFQAAHVDYSGSIPKLLPMGSDTSFVAADFVRDFLCVEPDSQGYIVETYVAQHPWYSAPNPTSVNTLRVYTICKPGEKAIIHGGYLRIGRQGSTTDNASAGGVYFCFDPESGKLASGLMDTVGSPRYSSHPDSGVLLEGSYLPLWDAVKNLVPKTMAVFPETIFAGMDIAVTEEGPIIIEINCRPDRTGAYDIDLPTLDMLMA